MNTLRILDILGSVISVVLVFINVFVAVWLYNNGYISLAYAWLIAYNGGMVIGVIYNMITDYKMEKANNTVYFELKNYYTNN